MFSSFARRCLSSVTESVPERFRGVCKWFDVQKGFGFITPEAGGPDVFVHQTELHAPGYRSLNEGSRVEYELFFDEVSGKVKAIKVTGMNGEFVQVAPRKFQTDFLTQE